MTLLADLQVHHLRFTLQAQSIVRLGAQAGSQLRGALWQALQSFACTDPRVKRDISHQQHCPMCRLVARETDQGRGRDPARPFAIQPPLQAIHRDGLWVDAGHTFTIGISLFGDVADLFPYLVHAVYQMGQQGVGYGRGTFTIVDVRGVHPLLKTQQALFDHGKVIQNPSIPVTNLQIEQAAKQLPVQQVTMRFFTPTQITFEGKSIPHPIFSTLIARLVERCQSLQETYTATPIDSEVWREQHLQLTQQAELIHVAQDHTRWLTLHSGSRRSMSVNTLSGFVGDVTFAGDELATFYPWLLWGQSLHVGKNAAKGNGWYELAILEQ